MLVEKYSFGLIVIDGKEYSRDVIICPSGKISSWWRKEGHVLSLEDLPECLESRDVEFFVVGTGAYGRVDVLEEVRDYVKKLGIEFIARPTAEAIEEFNRLIKNGRKVVGAFHLTC